MASIELPSRPAPVPATRDEAVDKWNLAQPGFKGLSPQGKEFLYWVNYCRRNPEGFWNDVIVPNLDVFPPLNTKEAKSLKADLAKMGALPMFALSDKLTRTAQSHAYDISGKRAAPSHTSTNGTEFGERMKKAGIKYCASENISVSSQSPLLAVLLLYLDIGLPDLGHRKTLLNPNLLETGIGVASYGNNQLFLVQDLSCLQN